MKNMIAKNMIAKNIIAITLAAVGMLWARTAEAATVTSGFYTTTEEIQNGMVSGGMSPADNFTVTSFVVIPGVFLSPIDFRNGFLPGPVFPTFVPGAGVGADGDSMIGTITIPNGSCGPPITKAAGCGVAMDFRFDPNTLGLPGGVTTLDEPFTMTGHLTVPGTAGLDIDGSGMLHATLGGVTFNFAAPEPSSLILMLIGLGAVSWSRWRLGKRAGSSRSTAAAD